MHPGKRIQHYILIEQVGQGGQAAVWSAEDELLKRTVAIKTISLVESSGDASMGTIAQQAQRFVTEARTIADLEHPFILPVYTYGQEGEWLYIVMRYMAGGTLKKLIGRDGMSLAEVIKLAGPLGDALDQAHQQQIIHRDIKSVNVLLDSQRRPYLADFGLSVTVGDSSSQSGSGTLAYMSPEQLRGDMADHRSDLYAFGTLLYEMFSAQTPTINGSHWNLSQLMSGTDLPNPDNKIPAEILTVLKRAMARDPADRYHSATAIVEALRVVHEGQTRPVNSSSSGTGDMLLTLDGVDSGAFDLSGGNAAPTRMGSNTPLDGGAGFFLMELLPINDPAMLALNKANTLFETALNDWADGAGRFRLYGDDYKFIESFYGASENRDLQLNEAGRRLMLRAALEHDYRIETWWQALPSLADRRAVALQTLSSELPSARLRAVEYLTLIEDSDPPAIPIRVATIISREEDPTVRYAGIVLLEERASAAKSWRDYAYNAIIDDVLTTLATKDVDGRVLELAARVIGRLRSTHAANGVAALADEDPRAMLSLTNIRDETPDFPKTLPATMKRRAFIRLSLRQLFEHPAQLIARFAFIFIGAALGLGIAGYAVVRAQGTREFGTGGFLALFGLSGLIDTVLNLGITYGFFFAFGLFFSIEPARRLRAWGVPFRIAVSVITGGLLSYAAFALFRALYNNTPDPLEVPLWFILPAVIFVSGFAVGCALSEKTWVRTLAGFGGIVAGLLINWIGYSGGRTPDYLFFLDNTGKFGVQAVVSSLIIGGVIAVFAFMPEWSRIIRERARRINF